MVDCIDVDVVDVQQQVAITLVKDRANKFCFAHLGNGLRIVRRIFQGNTRTQHILNLAYTCGNIANRLGCEWNGEKIVKVALRRTIREVLGIKRYLAPRSLARR